MLLNEAQTDWLGSRPVFYHEITGKISYNINEVIDFDSFALSPEGLGYFLKYGYCVYGLTPVEHVKFLRYDAQIQNTGAGRPAISFRQDSAETLYGRGEKRGTDVFEALESMIKEWGEKARNPIVLPLSGGYDSRILAWSLRNQNHVHCYSYGFSERQEESFEAVKAKRSAEYSGLPWTCIPLGNFLSYVDEWYGIYGPSMHLHGMYQMEFYHKILELRGDIGQYLLSGIIGDAWAGNTRIPEISSPDELKYLSYSHGLCIEENVSLLSCNNEAEQEFFEEHRDKLKEENWRVLFAMRTKLMLLSYLYRTPENLGMKMWTPFLDKNMAMDMLNLNWEEKTDRKWQQEAFEKRGLNFGWMKKECDYNMTLEMQALRRWPLAPLDVSLLGRIIRSDYVELVNSKMMGKPWKSIPAKPKTVGNLYNKAIRYRNWGYHEYYGKYLVLGALERLLRQAEQKKGVEDAV